MHVEHWSIQGLVWTLMPWFPKTGQTNALPMPGTGVIPTYGKRSGRT